MGGLEEFMQYTLRVASFNRIGLSSFSDPIADITRESSKFGRQKPRKMLLNWFPEQSFNHL